MLRILAAVLVLAASTAAAEARDVKAGPLTLSGLAMRATPAGVPTSAAYLTISNAGKTADRLLSVQCACAASAMMHESKTQNGISSMSMLSSVAVPAGGKVAFTPTGLHIMLVGLKAPLKAGGLQPMTLRFEKAGAVKVEFPVQAVIPLG